MIVWLLVLALLTAQPLQAPVSVDVTVVSEDVEEYWSTGKVRRRYQLDDQGRRHGSYSEYYESGELEIRARYKAGDLDGTYATFYEDGAKHIYARYRAGLLHGKYTERIRSGDLGLTAVYDKGELDGTCTLYADGKASMRQRWKGGVLVDIDGVVPFPRPLELLSAELLAIRAAAPERAGPDADEEQRLALERRRGLERLKEYRALVGLRYEDLELVDDYNLAAQWGAKLCHAIDRLDHTPANPGWDEADYQLGYRGTSNSNLASVDDLARSIDMYLDDSDASNLDRIGHRMHCLAGALKKTGFGSFEGYSAMWSMDRSGRRRDVDVAAYPPAGHVPVDRFHGRIAWSLTFAPGFRRVPDVSGVEVRVRALDERSFPHGEALELDHKARLGNHTLVFRPVGLEVKPEAGYWVEIHGLAGAKRGEPYRYLVRFVDLEQAPLAGPTDDR